MIVGIDPGLSGALAFFSPDGLVIHDMPTHALTRGGKAKREIDLIGLAQLIDSAKPPISHAYVEAVGARPGQGSVSMFAFGKAYGIVLGVLAANFVPHTLVPPQRWKKALGVPADKDGARARASQLLPQHAALWSRVKDDGRAESALIAYWGARQ